jgi:hypothetical protein
LYERLGVQGVGEIAEVEATFDSAFSHVLHPDGAALSMTDMDRPKTAV